MTPFDIPATPDPRAIKAQCRRSFTALAHQRRAVELRNVAAALGSTAIARETHQKAWRHLYRADAWQALAEGDASLARSLHRAAIRPAPRVFA